MEPIWATLLAKALEGKNVKELLSNVGAGGAPTASGPAVPAAGGDKPAAEEKKEEKEEKEEESDEDMVRSSLMVFDLNIHRLLSGFRSFRLITHLVYLRLVYSFACLFIPCQNPHIDILSLHIVIECELLPLVYTAETLYVRL